MGRIHGFRRIGGQISVGSMRDLVGFTNLILTKKHRLRSEEFFERAGGFGIGGGGETRGVGKWVN